MKPRILIVYPDKNNASPLLQACQEAGYEAEVVTNFEAAVDIVATHCPDAVIAAVRLGRFNGLHLAMRCHALQADLPIIIVGAGSDASLAADATSCDVQFVTSPAQATLLTMVREALNRSKSVEAPPITSGSADTFHAHEGSSGFSID
jgi:DNA-binding NtrC family response regulator